MTNSFQGSSLGFNTSKYNYESTEVDMTEAVNKQIDDNVKQMDAHFDRLIKMSNDQIKGRSQQWQQLAKFTKQGMQFANFVRQRNEAIADMQGYYNEDKYNTRLKEEIETDKLDADLNESHKVNYTASAALENIDPDLAKLLKAGKDGSITQKEMLRTALGYSTQWYEKAQETYLTEVAPGDWRTFNDPRNTAVDRRIISADLDSTYISQFEDAGISKRYLRKHLIKPMMQQHEERLLKVQQAHIAAEKITQTAKRQSEFITNFRDSPGEAIEEYLQTYHSYHAEASGELSSGYVLAKAELQGFIVDAIKNGEFKDDEYEDLEKAFSEYLLTPNDGGKPRTIDEYLPQFVSPIRKAIRQARLDKLEGEKEDRKIAQLEFENPYLNDWRERKEPPSEDEVQEAAKAYMSEFGESSQTLSNYLSQQDIDDIDIEANLTERWLDGEEIRLEDLDGITGAEMKAKWMQRATQGGLNSAEIKDRDADITAAVNEKTFEDDLDKAKTTKWRTIYKNAIQKFNNTYRKEIELGQSHEVAKGIALETAEAYIQKPEAAVRPKYSRDETRANNILSTKIAISKDNNIIYSSDPWAGEEKELQSALRYITTGKGAIPQYYRQFPGINLTPYELMQTRLVSTGTLKESEVEPIPERELDPVQQDLLLNKPSPARANRALLDEYGVENIEELVELTGADSVEQLLEALRLNAERNNQLSGWEISQVNIDPALEEEHTQVVGEQSPFMRLNTMLPGVATAYVEEIYNV